MPDWLWLPAGLVLAVLAYGIWTFNRLVALRKRGDGAWSDIDVQLKRRADLVPALVETVKGYARHESTTLEAAVAARNQAAQATTVADRAEREQSVARAVGRLFALAEAYPDLKASAGFQQLHRSLVDVEDHLQSARRYYNAVVRDYNTLVESFPPNVVANLTGFPPRDFFQLDSQSERAVPPVTFAPPPEARA
jgi:LemA protein